MDPIVLSQLDFDELKAREIGPRIRYMREMLQAQDKIFSLHGTATRVGIISTSALGALERGETKDPSARVLYAIAKDFGIPMEVFFDEYYEGDYKPIVLLGEAFFDEIVDATKDTDMIFGFEQVHELMGHMRALAEEEDDPEFALEAVIKSTYVVDGILAAYGVLIDLPGMFDDPRIATTQQIQTAGQYLRGFTEKDSGNPTVEIHVLREQTEDDDEDIEDEP